MQGANFACFGIFLATRSKHPNHSNQYKKAKDYEIIIMIVKIFLYVFFMANHKICDSKNYLKYFNVLQNDCIYFNNYITIASYIYFCHNIEVNCLNSCLLIYNVYKIKPVLTHSWPNYWFRIDRYFTKISNILPRF